VLLREEIFSKKTGRSKVKKAKKQKTHTTLSNKEGENLFQTLRTHRLELASEQKVPHLLFLRTLHYWKWFRQGSQQLQRLVNYRE
jgi:hypothetical protein